MVNEKEFISKYVGKTLDVLIEQQVKGNDDLWEGYTRNYIKVLANKSVASEYEPSLHKFTTDSGSPSSLKILTFPVLELIILTNM